MGFLLVLLLAGTNGSKDPSKPVENGDRSTQTNHSAGQSGNESTAEQSDIAQKGDSPLQLFLPRVIQENLLLKVLLTLVLIICLNGAISWVFYTDISGDLNQQVDRQVRATTELQAGAYDNWFENRWIEMRNIFSGDRLINEDPEEISETLLQEQLANDHVSNFHYVAVSSGQIVASSSEQAITANITVFGINRGDLRKQRFVHTRQYTSIDGRDVIALGYNVPFVDFVLIAEIPAEKAGPAIQQPIEGATTSVVSTGNERLLGPPTDEPIPQNISDVTVTTTDETILAYHSLSSVDDGYVVSQTPRKTAFSLRDAVLRSFAITIFLTFTVLIGAIVVGGRSMLGDISELARRAETMGEGNLGISLRTARDDEIGVLYAEFDQMRHNLKERVEEAERLNHQLQVTDRLLRHNLHNDMNVIQLNAEAIRDGYSKTPEKEAETIIQKGEDLLEKTDKQREITNTLLLDTDGQSIDTVGTLKQVLETFDSQYPNAVLSLDAPERATVNASQQLSKALSELVENAIIHNDRASPEVQIQVNRDDTTVTIEIADNGPGMPKMDQRILTGHREIDQLNHGSGVGLWLVYWIVRQSGGQLRYEPNEQRGTVVMIELPRIEQSDPPPSSESGKAESELPQY